MIHLMHVGGLLLLGVAMAAIPNNEGTLKNETKQEAAHIKGNESGSASAHESDPEKCRNNSSTAPTDGRCCAKDIPGLKTKGKSNEKKI